MAADLGLVRVGYFIVCWNLVDSQLLVYVIGMRLKVGQFKYLCEWPDWVVILNYDCNNQSQDRWCR